MNDLAQPFEDTPKLPLPEGLHNLSLEDIYRHIGELATQAQSKLDPEPVRKFQTKILGNELPSPEETEEMIDAVIGKGRYEAIRDLIRELSQNPPLDLTKE